MVDFVTTSGELVLSADDSSTEIPVTGDVLQMTDGRLFVVIQRTWLYKRVGIEIVNPIDTNKRSTAVVPSIQCVVKEVTPDAGNQ